MKCKTFILSLLVLNTLLFSCKNEEKEVAQAGFSLTDQMLKTTKAEQVRLEHLKNEMNFYGKIQADNNKMIEVYPVVGGNVTKVYVELGDYVKKGELLATIQSTTVAGFEKDMDDAKNDLLVAQNSLKTNQELFDGKLVAERDVVAAKSNLEKANSQLKRMQQTYSIYNVKKGAIYEVRSPINGFVIEKNINQDMLLRDDRTDNIFDVAEISKVWAMANINETDINQVKMGMKADVVTLSYPDKGFYGNVDKIYNIIDPDTKAMKVRITLDNKDYLLKPEMRANISLSSVENEQMLAIPSIAVIFDKSKNYVMVFHDKSNIETRQVEVFRQVGDVTYLSNSIKEGEKIVTNNQLLIYDALND